MDCNLHDLKFFETVAELGHIGRAASVLGRSQPAITKCIRRLEKTVGSPLFTREGRGIRLTPIGGLLVERARQLLRHASEVGRELTDFSLGHSGHVRIGGGLSAAEDVISDVCGRILAENAGLTLDIVVATNISLREELREGRIDLLLGLIPVADPEFVTVPLASDVVVLAARRTHPLFKRRRYDLETLVQHPWALPTRAIPSRQWLDVAFAAHNVQQPVIHVEVNSPPLLPGIAERADLIAFIPRRMINARKGSALREIPVPEMTLERHFGVTYRKGGYLSPAAQRTLELLVLEGRALFSHGLSD
jgi:DNA-binding transcriptional LysR family regulator